MKYGLKIVGFDGAFGRAKALCTRHGKCMALLTGGFGVDCTMKLEVYTNTDF